MPHLVGPGTIIFLCLVVFYKKYFWKLLLYSFNTIFKTNIMYKKHFNIFFDIHKINNLFSYAFEFLRLLFFINIWAFEFKSTCMIFKTYIKSINQVKYLKKN